MGHLKGYLIVVCCCDLAVNADPSLSDCSLVQQSAYISCCNACHLLCTSSFMNLEWCQKGTEFSISFSVFSESLRLPHCYLAPYFHGLSLDGRNVEWECYRYRNLYHISALVLLLSVQPYLSDCVLYILYVYITVQQL